MKNFKFSIILLIFFTAGSNLLFGQFYEPDGFDYAEQVGFESELYADNSEADISWAILNPSELDNENRLNDIEKYNIATTNPFNMLGDDFCWKETYGRGVGTIPTICPSGLDDYQNLLCYRKCAPGYTGAANYCWRQCPNGWYDFGVGCSKPSYNRGVGRVPDVSCPPGYSQMGVGAASWCHRWWLPHSTSSSWSCRSNEEYRDGLCYTKCQSGYTGTITKCTAVCPSGFTNSTYTCTKTSYHRGAGQIRNRCANGLENNAGLCYNACKAPFVGVGPVCWEDICPVVNGQSWVQCGMGCASSEGQCASAIIDMVVSPFAAIASIAGLVVTFGGSGAVSVSTQAGIKTFTKVVDVAGKAASLAQNTISIIESDLVQSFLATNGRQPTSVEMKGLKEYAVMSLDAIKTYDMSWKDFTGLDPTGLASVAAAYAHPLCKNVAGNTSGAAVPVYFHSQAGLSLYQANSISNQNRWKVATPQQVQAAFDKLNLNVYAFGMMSDGRFAVPVQSNHSNFYRGANIGAVGGNQGFFYTK